MELSLYNILIPHGQYAFLYNTFNQEALVLSADSKHLMEECYSSKDRQWSRIEGQLDTKLKDQLISKEFVVSSYELELQRVEELEQKVREDKTALSITLVPTLACNFRCWYCYEDHRDATRISPEELQSLLTYIESHITKTPELTMLFISWFGGEPLLAYREVIVPFMEEALHLCQRKSIDLTSGMTTNGYLLEESMIGNFERWGLDHFQITIDGNEQQHNSVRCSSTGKGSYRKILQNIALLANRGLGVTIRINVSDETELAPSILIADLEQAGLTKRKHVKFHIEKVWQASSKVQATIEHMQKVLQTNEFQVSSIYNSPHTLRIPCYADRDNQLVLAPYGRLYKCTARDFNADNAEGVLLANGVLAWNERTCKRKACRPTALPACRRCSILPICNGGCSQGLLEAKVSDSCPYGWSEADKQEKARRYLEKILM